MLFVGGLGFSGAKDFYFDFENKKYKPVFRIGLFKVGKWVNFKSLDYIAVFKNVNGQYEVNIWHDKNKHFNIILLTEKLASIKEGEKIARQLNVDLYDATNPRDPKWIKLNK